MTEYEREAMRKTRMMLGRWGCAMMEIRRMERRSRVLIDLMHDLTPTIRAQQITGMPRGSGVSDPVGRAVEQMEQRRAEYQRELDAIDAEIRQRRSEQERIDEMMRTWLSDLQIQIIDLHYREGRTYEYIAGKLSYSSERAIRKQEEKAVRRLSYRMGEIGPKSSVCMGYNASMGFQIAERSSKPDEARAAPVEYASRALKGYR